MPRKDDADQLREAKRAYRAAESEGNRSEEARWANTIGHLLKNRGEYVKALEWLRRDYEVSIKYLPEKQLLPTCQSLGELHLRLQNYEDALIYQKKHLELAKEMNDLVEQQRATTQLGRTYHEMFLNSEDDHSSIRNAKKYFKSAMRLAENLKRNAPCAKFSFVKEYVDAHNNLGMLEMDIDNLEEAQRILSRGLEICEEEEVTENDDGRSRLHHNLGNVHMMARRWDEAEEHIKKDVSICRRIGHCQGEAKGYINLGELYYKVQKYDEAMSCYQKALELAKSMEDEDALVRQIDQNIETVKEATKVMDDLKKEEQYLKKLVRNMENARGTTGERKCLLQQLASLDRLIEKSRLIFAWLKHREYAKKKKRIAGELCDKEKLADSFLAIGESYEKLRKFKKALKWYMKSWKTYKLIGNLEGQALAKIDIGDILDSDGDWRGAYDAFEEAYRTAVEAKLPSIQLSALENMHYSQMIRFDNVEQARSLRTSIDNLKASIEQETVLENCCSETETEIDEQSPNRHSARISSENSMPYSHTPTCGACADDFNENSPLISFLHHGKSFRKRKTTFEASHGTYIKPLDSSPMSKSRSTDSQTIGRKRVRLVLSDDECKYDEEHSSSSMRVINDLHVEEVATSNGSMDRNIHNSPHKSQDLLPVVSKCAVGACAVSHEHSACSERSRISKFSPLDARRRKSPNSLNGCKIGAASCRNLFDNHDVSGPTCSASCHGSCKHILVKINEDVLHMQPETCIVEDKLSIERMKVEVACLYYLQLHIAKRAKGLVPVIQQIKFDGRSLEAPETAPMLNDIKIGTDFIEVLIGAWVPKPVLKYYIDFCLELSEQPNLNVLKKLYNLEVSEDEVVVSDCELQDISIAPLLMALEAHKTVAVIDLSHNVLGNGTMEKLQQVLSSSGQNYGGLVLDLHSNRLGPTSLFQVCECPVLFSRLEVLNIAGNRLTDACATYVSTILKNCKALYALNIEQCSITSRTIQKIADSLDGGSVLAHLSIGHNHSISGNAIIGLLLKLAALTRFQEISLCGIKLSKHVIDGLCQLSKTSSLSSLLLGGTGIGSDGALDLTKSLALESREQVKLDLSSSGLTVEYAVKLNVESSLISGILELNLAENPLEEEGAKALASLLQTPQCCIRVLVLRKCQFGLAGVLQILEALSENCCLEELNLAGNFNLEENHASPCSLISLKENSNSNSNSNSTQPSVSVQSETSHQELCILNTEDSQLEVPDSDDEPGRDKDAIIASDADGLSILNNSQLQPKFLHPLLASVNMAKNLKVLDLSDNGISQNVVVELCNVWSSGPRAGCGQSHFKDGVVHLSVQGYKCCGMRPCCRKI